MRVEAELRGDSWHCLVFDDPDDGDLIWEGDIGGPDCQRQVVAAAALCRAVIASYKSASELLSLGVEVGPEVDRCTDCEGDTFGVAPDPHRCALWKWNGRVFPRRSELEAEIDGTLSVLLGDNGGPQVYHAGIPYDIYVKTAFHQTVEDDYENPIVRGSNE